MGRRRGHRWQARERENQRLASDLSSDLSSRFALAGYEAKLAVSKHYVIGTYYEHLDCTAVRGHRSCCIHCAFNGDPKFTGYTVDFQEGGASAAVGRTPLKSEADVATAEWLGGSSLSSLRQRFEFIDREKRAVEALKAQIIQAFPRLGAVDSGVSYRWAEPNGYEFRGSLEFRAEDRQCEVYFDFFPVPVAWAGGISFDPFSAEGFLAGQSFGWDEIGLFNTRTEDTSLLGSLIGRWLCDRDLPSVMRAQVPEAHFYSRRVERYQAGWSLEEILEEEYLESWDSLQGYWERRGDDAGNPPEPAEWILFLRAIRQAGYDRRLRAGTSMFWDIIFSRARENGLSDDQHQVRFRFRNGLQISGHLDGDFEMTLPEVAFTPEVDRLLRQLADYDFD